MKTSPLGMFNNLEPQAFSLHEILVICDSKYLEDHTTDMTLCGQYRLMIFE